MCVAREPRRDAGAAEVVGTLLMLTLSVSIYLLLSNAALDQARQTAAYIRGLVPEGEAPVAPEQCIPLKAGTWCKRLPQEPGEEEQCVLDDLGWQWCLEAGQGKGSDPPTSRAERPARPRRRRGR